MNDSTVLFFVKVDQQPPTPAAAENLGWGRASKFYTDKSAAEEVKDNKNARAEALDIKTRYVVAQVGRFGLSDEEKKAIAS